MNGSKRHFVVCIRAEESSDIEVRKIYQVLPDETAAKRGYLRIVDESGEDYLYPKECFSPVQLQEKAIRALRSVASTTNARPVTAGAEDRGRRSGDGEIEKA